jgi:hypothetical protein
MRSTPDFSSEAMQSRMNWDHIFKVLEEENAKQEFYTQQK